MKLQATDSMTVYRHPVESEDQRDEDEVADGASPRYWPLQDGRRRYVRPLAVDGSEDEPDEFDVQDRLPLEFAGDEPQVAGRRARRIGEDIIETFGFLMEVEGEDDI